ncbi:MAG: hypothetical protein A2Z14_11990 [Chloroflexi bacterium RBG_16_48_8]|nr:MAG: hypothetical protein A2Z14_11990 [Chloroflexi bacterium RBG_16_48_8]
MNSNLELFWSKILSEEPSQITVAIHSLSEEERRAVMGQLQRIAHETGWLEEQRRRAQTALVVFEKEVK